MEMEMYYVFEMLKINITIDYAVIDIVWYNILHGI